MIDKEIRPVSSKRIDSKVQKNVLTLQMFQHNKRSAVRIIMLECKVVGRTASDMGMRIT